MNASEGSIIVDRDEHIVTITLNRPEVRNAVNYPMLDLFEQVLDNIVADLPRAVIVTATAPGFCAGIDLKESRTATPEFANQRVTAMHRLLHTLRRLPVPVITAIDGVATGLGCELAISGDLRVASPRSRFSYPEPRVGVPSPSHHLIWLIGLARAQEMLLTARWVGAAEAASTGLVTAIDDAPLEKARELAEQIATLAPMSIADTKANIWTAIDMGATAASQHHIAGVTAAASTADRREALEAFAEKREPRFTGR
jgi:enoyl-CoA hydratase/carnithine racemase